MTNLRPLRIIRPLKIIPKSSEDKAIHNTLGLERRARFEANMKAEKARMDKAKQQIEKRRASGNNDAYLAKLRYD